MAAQQDLTEEPVPTVSISQFGKGSRLVRQVAEMGRPTVITDGGVEVAVLLDIAAYQAMRHGRGDSDLRRTLLAATAEADAGTFIDDEVVMAEIHAEFEGLVPPEVLAELDRA